MKIALGQINTHLGNFEYNSNKILEFSKNALKEKYDLIAFPELSLLGYAPNDLLERPEVLKLQNKFLKKLTKSLPKEIGVVLGCLVEKEKHLYNGGVFIYKNKIQKTFTKSLLPSYDVFDEPRFFSNGNLKENIFKFKNKKILLSICEDIWFDNFPNKYDDNPFNSVKTSVDITLCLNASPFALEKNKKRIALAKKISAQLKCDFYYVNQVGAQDELIFDGSSFFTDGKKVKHHHSFRESSGFLQKKEKEDKYKKLFDGLCLGIRDYVKKNSFEKVHLGLSGGIDSALVATLAAYALGPDNLTCIALPGPYSSDLSLDLAKKLSNNLKAPFLELDINKTYNEFKTSFDKSFGKSDFGLTHENAQARLRALFLMAFSNKNNSLLLATSNKSELCVGYSTLYGDQCGALMPIGDLLKTEVVELCEWINQNFKTPIPKKIISRPPSAELRPNQKDSDSLPSYDKLDASVDKLIRQKKLAQSDLDQWVLKKSYFSEFKRWQAPPILKVTDHAFGRGRRMPLSHGIIK